jgi:hypothetical protein
MKEDLIEKLLGFKEKFQKDEKTIALISELKKRYNEIQDEFFTDEDFVSYEFDEVNEEYWCEVKESDVEEREIFDVLWFD